MGSIIPTGRGAGRGGYRPGAGRKKAPPAVTPEPVDETPEPFQTPESKAAKKQRAESFRRYARERTLEELAALSDEIFQTGTRSERVAFLMWLSANGFGTAPKAPEVREEGRSMTEILAEIAKARTLAESKPALPPAPPQVADAAPGASDPKP